MKAYFAGLLATLFWCSIVSAQNQDDYRPLRSKGAMPQRFITSSTSKYQAEVARISHKERGSSRKQKEQFYLESSFAIDELLRSGKVLFNDTVSQYCNRVMDELLKHDPELRAKIEVYAVKSPSVNAFTTNSGLVLVNVGLLAQLENEAQLAFILAHEVTHYVKQHSLNEYIEKQKILKGQGIYRNSSLEDRLLSRSRYSKRQETEADLEGLELYLKSKYSLDVIEGVFDVLKYAHLPFDEVTFKPEFLETQYLKFPEGYRLKETKTIEADENEDSLGTHPGALARQKAVMEELEGENHAGRFFYIVSEKEFLAVQKICRFEQTHLYIHNRNYEEALYNSYLLLQEYPNSKYLKKSVGKSLYGLSKYASAGEYDDVHEEYEKVQGSRQGLVYLLEKTRSKELSVLALVHLYQLNKEFPQDAEIRAWKNDIFFEFSKKYKKRDFFATAPKVVKDTTATVTGPEGSQDTTTAKRGSKYEKIKKAQQSEKPSTSAPEKEDSYIKYALIAQLNDKAFVAQYDSLIQVHQDETDYVKRRSKKDKRNASRFGMNKVVFINPHYVKIDQTSKNSMQYIASESAQRNLTVTMEEMAKKVGLRHEILDNHNLKPDGTETFNDLTILTEYFDESFAHEDVTFINHLSDEMQELKEKYGTNYFCWTGVVSVRETHLLNGLSCIVCFPPLSVMGIYKTIAPKFNTFLYTIVIDAAEGGNVVANMDSFRYRDRQDVLRSSLYDTYSKFKKKKRKK